MTMTDIRPAPKKFVAKGHDAQLQEAQYNSLPVYLLLLDAPADGWEEGKIVRRDKYTVTFRCATGQFAGLDQIVYKHAIAKVVIKRLPA